MLLLRNTFLLTVCLLCYGTAFAQPAADLKTLTDRFSNVPQEWDVPGLAIGIIKDGKVVLARGFGVREVGQSAPVDEHTVFAIASNTKAFVATALGMLVADGQLDWDDPVQRYLPYFQLYDSYVSAHTTVRDLLCHRVGLGTFSGDAIWYKNEMSAEAVVRLARHVPQAYPFRAGYGYSNLMFITAGEVIRAVSGQPWDEYIKQRIFQPLGMDRTRTAVSQLSSMTNVATPHQHGHGAGSQPIAYANWDNMGAAGGILSSVHDMLRWAELQLQGGTYQGQQLFGPALQRETWKVHNPFGVSEFARQLYGNRHHSGYGLGWGIADYGGVNVYSHGGGYDGMYSRVMLVPELQLGVVVLTNGMRGVSTPITYAVLDHYLGRNQTDWLAQGQQWEQQGNEAWQERYQKRLAARVSGTRPTHSLDDYAGLYTDPMYGTLRVEISSDQPDSLRLIFEQAPSLNATLTHWHYDTWQINWEEEHAWFDFGTLQFVSDNNREITELRFDVPNDDIFFHELKAVRQAEE